MPNDPTDTQTAEAIPDHLDGKYPDSDEYEALQAGGFADYRLRINGLVDNPTRGTARSRLSTPPGTPSTTTRSYSRKVLRRGLPRAGKRR